MPLITPTSYAGLATIAACAYSDMNITMLDGIRYYQQQPERPFSQFVMNLERLDWLYREAARLGVGYIKDWIITPELDLLSQVDNNTNWLINPAVDWSTHNWGAYDRIAALGRQYKIVTGLGFPRIIPNLDTGPPTPSQWTDRYFWPMVQYFVNRYIDYHDIFMLYLTEEPTSEFGGLGQAQVTFYDMIKGIQPQFSVGLAPTFQGLPSIEGLLSELTDLNRMDAFDISCHHTSGPEPAPAAWNAYNLTQKIDAGSIVFTGCYEWIYPDYGRDPVHWAHEFSMHAVPENTTSWGERVGAVWKKHKDTATWRDKFSTAIAWMAFGQTDPDNASYRSAGDRDPDYYNQVYGGNGLAVGFGSRYNDTDDAHWMYGIWHCDQGPGQPYYHYPSPAYAGIQSVYGPPPLTTLSYFANNEITLESTNVGATIYYTTDGSTPTYPVAGTTQVYSSPIPVSGTTTVKCFSRTTASEAVKTIIETEVTTPPVTHIGPPPWISIRHRDPNKIYLWPECKLARGKIDIFYRIDGSAWQEYDQPFDKTGTIIEWYGKDHHGNEEGVRGSYTVIPSSSLSISGNTITITAWSGANIYYKLNGAGNSIPYTGDIIFDDHISIEYYAEDAYYQEQPKTKNIQALLYDRSGVTRIHTSRR